MRTLNQSLVFLLLVAASATAPVTKANDADQFAYFGLEPVIVTNYLTARDKLGFIRVNVELMIKDADHLELIEYHSPLIRATIIEVLGDSPEEKIKSLSGREEIRVYCLDTINQLLTEETGQPLLENLLFTHYLYQ